MHKNSSPSTSRFQTRSLFESYPKLHPAHERTYSQARLNLDDDGDGDPQRAHEIEQLEKEAEKRRRQRQILEEEIRLAELEREQQEREAARARRHRIAELEADIRDMELRQERQRERDRRREPDYDAGTTNHVELDARESEFCYMHPQPSYQYLRDHGRRGRAHTPSSTKPDVDELYSTYSGATGYLRPRVRFSPAIGHEWEFVRPRVYTQLS